MPIDVIDLFAGPGGLGEGFSRLDEGRKFKIAVSAEMEPSAHKTLTLRSFYRHALREGDKRALDAYYAYCNSGAAPHPSVGSNLLWQAAVAEAQLLTLGEAPSNSRLDAILEEKKLDGDNTVLIGGPPCQAYSLVGRARNRGKKNYVPADDHRHFLYKEYLRILAISRPAVFIMENVKGILSSRMGGELIFHDILEDLTNPAKAMGHKTGAPYIVYSMSTETLYKSGMDLSEIDPANFILKSENYGIPQARHRVILLGIREPFAPATHPLLATHNRRDVRFALKDLPKLRSRLSKDDSPDAWYRTVRRLSTALADDACLKGNDLANQLRSNAGQLAINLPTGGVRLEKKALRQTEDSYLRWVRDDRLDVWLQHEVKSHMASDLARYFYAATFTKVNGRSPKGHADFSLAGLAPAHKNWRSGMFVDRFRVQQSDRPGSTVTSHIAKDGHYFIHYDPAQCRSLTVREAARLQTFPDNYFFQGNRTQQYHQVGNAVPPLLAREIASICSALPIFSQR